MEQAIAEGKGPGGGPALHQGFQGQDDRGQVRRPRHGGPRAEEALCPADHPVPVHRHPGGGGPRRRAPDQLGA
ncbi:MAG: hypothetical protein MZV70_73245 [Desulfobacterales bacterium]|nr:hypothetical protein [Desulfobacterales bacterium]